VWLLPLADGRQGRRSHPNPKGQTPAPQKSARLQDHFKTLTDPRRRKVKYPLVNIVLMAICAVICGAEDFVVIAALGRNERQWLARHVLAAVAGQEDSRADDDRAGRTGPR